MSSPLSVSFRPSRVEGIEGVTEVQVSRAHLDLLVAGVWLRLPFRAFRSPREGRVVGAFRRLLGRTPRLVGERDWFHPAGEKFFRWYTSPPITTFLPASGDQDWSKSLFLRVQEVLWAGNCGTFDLG